MTAHVTTLTLGEVEEWIGRLGVSYQERALRYALKGVGVEPVAYGVNEKTKKGRILYYDGLVPWVIASAALTQRGPLKDLSTPLATYRRLAGEVLANERGRIERLANYMFISSAEYGMDVPQLVTAISRDHSVLDIVPEDGDTLTRLLVAYQRHRAAWEHGLDVTSSQAIDYDTVRQAFADVATNIVVGPSGTDADDRSDEDVFKDIFDPEEYLGSER